MTLDEKIEEQRENAKTQKRWQKHRFELVEG